MAERMEQIIQNETCKNPGYFLEPLTIFMSNEIISVIAEDFSKDGVGTKLAADVRSKLLAQGIQLPIVRLRDLMGLKPREFIIMTYDTVMYQEDISDEKEISAEYLIEKLEEAFRLKYNAFLNIAENFA